LCLHCTVQKNASDVPKPCFFPLVFTDINGKHNYAGCLTFYEPVPEPDVRRLVKFVRRAVGLGERRKVRELFVVLPTLALYVYDGSVLACVVISC
jgi:hypothetical protein